MCHSIQVLFLWISPQSHDEIFRNLARRQRSKRSNTSNMDVTMADLTKLVVETQQSATKLLADGMTAQNACAWDSAFKTSANREIHNSEDLKVTQTSLLKALRPSTNLLVASLVPTNALSKSSWHSRPHL